VISKVLRYLLASLSALSMVLSSLSCGGGFSTSPENLPGKLIVNISQAQTDTERQAAIQKVICNSLSLGFVDANGNQLNPNVQEGNASLTVNDMAALSYFISEAQGYTIKDIVDFLAGFGILLSSTQKAITADEILPDIQEYVDWSYAHRDDSRSLLGLALASGPEMQVVGASPKFSGDTHISAAAGLMMLADILVGVPGNKQISSSQPKNIAFAADSDNQELALKAQGLITKIEAGPQYKSLWDEYIARKANQGQKVQIKVPDTIKTIIASFAAGNQFTVRLYWIKNDDEIRVAKSLELLKDPITFDRSLGAPLFLAPVLTVVPSGNWDQKIPVTFSLNLISPFTGYDQSAPLFPDADAVFLCTQDWTSIKIEQGGHRLGIIQAMQKSSGFTISIKDCSNTERKIALLHISAQINVPDLAEWMVGNLEYLKLLQLNTEDILDLYTVMGKAVQVTPWVCEVIIPPAAKEVRITPTTLSGETGKEYEFYVEGDPPPEGCKYRWVVRGGGLPSQEVQQERGPLKYTFQKEGTYTISMTVLDSNLKTWAEASPSNVTIKAGVTSNITLDVEPPPLLETLQTLNFKVKSNVSPELLPQNTVWKWDFGDDSQPVTKVGRTAADLVCGHNYYKNGGFNVKVSLVDKTSGQVLATTTKSIVVDDSASIRKTDLFKIGLRVYGTEEYGMVTNGVYQKQGTQDTHIVGGATFPREYAIPTLQQTFVWKDGGAFEATWKNIATTSRGTQTTIMNVQGHIAVTPEGIQLYSCTYNYSMSFPNYEGKGIEWKVTEKWDLKDILLTKNAWGEKPEYLFRLEGKNIAQHIIKLTSEEYSPSGSKYIFLNPQWDNLPSGDPPYIEVVFDTTD
jgi:PKD repeat protein